jgi:hypothetical protein
LCPWERGCSAVSVRTPEELCDETDRNLAWRRLELSALRRQMLGAELVARNALVRAGVAMLYAHWEGYVKEAASAYISMVAVRRLQCCELSASLVATVLRSRIESLQFPLKTSSLQEITGFILDGMVDRPRLRPDGVIRTDANLNHAVLREILFATGIAYEPPPPRRDPDETDHRREAARVAQSDCTWGLRAYPGGGLPPTP